MPMAPVLSVVMPCYNHDRYLPAALDAVLAQSRPAHEVIVVDDGSTDRSAAVAEGYAAKHKSVSVLRLERNRGLAGALNAGFEKARGEYVMFPAADDKVQPGLFEKSLAQLEAHPRAGVASSLGVMISESGEELGPMESPVISERPLFVPPERFEALYREHGNWFVTYSVVLRRTVLEELGGFDAALGPNMDAYPTYYAASKYGSCFIPERLAGWRKLPTSLAETAGADLRRGLAIVEAFAAALSSGRHPGAFPAGFVETCKRQGLLLVMDRSLGVEPWPADVVADAVARLIRRTPLDSAFSALLRARPAAAKRLLKPYMALRQPPAVRRRLFKRKLYGAGAPA